MPGWAARKCGGHDWTAGKDRQTNSPEACGQSKPTTQEHHHGYTPVFDTLREIRRGEILDDAATELAKAVRAVDETGKVVTNGYDKSVTRAEWVMSKIVADDFNSQMKQHVVNVAGGLKDNLRRSLHETVNELLSEVFKVKSLDDATLQRTGDACIQPKAQ